MYRAVILPLAKQDIKKAAAWYESKQKGLGKRFVKEVRREVSYIKSKPNATAIHYDDTHWPFWKYFCSWFTLLCMMA